MKYEQGVLQEVQLNKKVTALMFVLKGGSVRLAVQTCL